MPGLLSVLWDHGVAATRAVLLTACALEAQEHGVLPVSKLLLMGEGSGAALPRHEGPGCYKAETVITCVWVTLLRSAWLLSSSCSIAGIAGASWDVGNILYSI